jgi:hypothetical protein
MRGEISYDLIMDDDMDFVEGTYRLTGGDWQVVIVSRRDVAEPEVVSTRCQSGVSGMFVRFPRCGRLNREVVEKVLGEALGVSEWVEVRGPDSMQLR